MSLKVSNERIILSVVKSLYVYYRNPTHHCSLASGAQNGQTGSKSSRKTGSKQGLCVLNITQQKTSWDFMYYLLIMLYGVYYF